MPTDFSFDRVEQLIDRKVESLRYELERERRERQAKREERRSWIFLGTVILAAVIFWTATITLGVSGR